MRGEHDVVEAMNRGVADRFILPHVDARTADMTGLERRRQRVEVDKAAACHVEDDGALGHRVELLGADHVGSLRRLGHMQRNHVRALAHLENVVIERDPVVSGELDRAIRVVADEVHAKCRRALRDELPHMAGAKDAERLALQLRADELGAVPLAILHALVGASRVARNGEHERHRLFGGRNDVGKRRIAYDNAALGGSLAVDVVDSDAGTTDDLELLARFDDLAGHRRGGSDDQGIIIGNHIEQLLGSGVGFKGYVVTSVFENGNAILRELLWNQDLHVASSAFNWTCLANDDHCKSLPTYSVGNTKRNGNIRNVLSFWLCFVLLIYNGL